LTFTEYDWSESYMGFPYDFSDETIILFLKDQTLDFKLYAMPYISVNTGEMYSYSISDSGGLLWCTISDLSTDSRYGKISPSIKRNFRAVRIKNTTGRVSKDWSKFSYQELKEMFDLED
jgi:hypothetical protein